MTSVARLMPSTSDSRQPYRLSNLDLVTESLTLMAGKPSSPSLRHLVQALHAGGGLLGDAADVRLEARRVARLGVHGSLANRREQRASSSFAGGLLISEASCSALAPRCTSSVASPPSSRIMLVWPPSGPLEDAVRVFPVLLERSRPCRRTPACRPRRSPPRHGPAWRKCCRRPSAPPRRAPERLDQHRSLDRHVQGPRDAGPLQRLARGELLADRHQTRASRSRRWRFPCGPSRPAPGRRL